MGQFSDSVNGVDLNQKSLCRQNKQKCDLKPNSWKNLPLKRRGQTLILGARKDPAVAFMAAQKRVCTCYATLLERYYCDSKKKS